MSDKFVAYRTAKSMLPLIAILVGLGAFLVLVDLSFLVPDNPSTARSRGRARTLEYVVMVLPYLGGFAVLVGLGVIFTVVGKRVEIEVSEEGITYPPALKETLPWDRIEKIAVRKITIYKVLSIWIRDADEFPIKPVARKVGQMNQISGDFGNFNIETMRAAVKFDDLLAAVEKHFPVEPLS